MTPKQSAAAEILRRRQERRLPPAMQWLEEPAMYKCVHGGRGSSKSWSIAKALVNRAVKKQELILCFREYQTSIKDSAKRVVEVQIQRMGYSNQFQVINDEIRHKENGTRFIFAGIKTNSDKIKSAEGITIAWGEEANGISQESWDDLDATIREDGAEVWLSWNPKRDSDPIHNMFVLEGRPESIVREVNFDQNPYFPKRLQKMMEWDRDNRPDFYTHRWLGHTVKNTDENVFNGKWKIDGSIEPGPDDVLYYGADFGFARDPSTLIRCWINDEKRELYVDYEFYDIGVETDYLPDRYDDVPGSRKWEITADCARPETISYIKRQGFKIKGSKKGAGSVEDGIEFLKSYTIVVHDRCKNTIDELGLYSYKVDKQTGQILPLLKDDHNHCVTGDTLVDTVDGQVAISDLVGKSGRVLSFDGIKKCVRDFFDVRMTRRNAPLVKIELDDGRSIRLTHDHLVMTQRGWVQAGSLQGDDWIVDVMRSED